MSVHRIRVVVSLIVSLAVIGLTPAFAKKKKGGGSPPPPASGGGGGMTFEPDVVQTPESGSAPATPPPVTTKRARSRAPAAPTGPAGPPSKTLKHALEL